MRVCLVRLTVFSFSLIPHKHLNNNSMTKAPFLISVVSNAQRREEAKARKRAEAGRAS